MRQRLLGTVCWGPLNPFSPSFEVVLVPFVKEKSKPNFVDFLCNCPVNEEELDLSRDPDDGSSREMWPDEIAIGPEDVWEFSERY